MYFNRAVITAVKYGHHPRLLCETIQNSLNKSQKNKFSIKMRDLTAFSVFKWKAQQQKRASKHTWSDGIDPGNENVKDGKINSNNGCIKRRLAMDTTTEKLATKIDGKGIATQIQNELREELQQWLKEGNGDRRAPKLVAILIGEDPASQTYVKNKMKAAADVGIESETKKLASTTTQSELLALIQELNNDSLVDGILVQLPLPEGINERLICNAVHYDKDVDGFNEVNMGRLCLDMDTVIPCTPLGVYELLRRTGVTTFGKNAVVVGRSKNVSLPIALLLHSDGKHEGIGGMDATVTICHRYTPPEELKRACLKADIIVTATGIPHLIKADMVKPGACIIDVGINRITDESTGKTKLVGDVDYDEVRKVAGYLTPVPGGVGPMTVAMLMKNTITASKLQQKS